MDISALEAYKQIIFHSNDFQNFRKKFEQREFVSQNDINELLQIAIMDEQLAELNYLISYSNSKTAGKADYDPEFQQHEKDEYDHKHDLIERLRTLDAPRLCHAIQEFPLANSNGNKWVQETSSDSFDILNHRYQEELEAIEFYDLVLRIINRVKEQTGHEDSTTKQLIKKIKADEEEHARDLKELIDQK